MKNKKINKIITFSIIGIILFISMLIFILNYTKDDSSFSILEKKWINDYKDKVVDVSLFNDVPIYGQNGKGIVFDILERFTKDYEVEFNKIPYFADTSTASNTQTSFKVLNNKDILTDKHILLYQDKVVKYESDGFSALSYRFSVRLYRNAKLFHRTGKSDDAFRKRTAPQSAKMPRRAQDAHSGAKRDSSGGRLSDPAGPAHRSSDGHRPPD